eukprot:gene3520-2471_t
MRFLGFVWRGYHKFCWVGVLRICAIRGGRAYAGTLLFGVDLVVREFFADFGFVGLVVMVSVWQIRDCSYSGCASGFIYLGIKGVSSRGVEVILRITLTRVMRCGLVICTGGLCSGCCMSGGAGVLSDLRAWMSIWWLHCWLCDVNLDLTCNCIPEIFSFVVHGTLHFLWVCFWDCLKWCLDGVCLEVRDCVFWIVSDRQMLVSSGRCMAWVVVVVSCIMGFFVSMSFREFAGVVGYGLFMLNLRFSDLHCCGMGFGFCFVGWIFMVLSLMCVWLLVLLGGLFRRDLWF